MRSVEVVFLRIDDPAHAADLTDFPEYDPDSSEGRTLRVGDALNMGGSRHPLGDDDEDASATFAIFPANLVLPRHAHAAARMEVVVRGSVKINATGEELVPGMVMITGPGEFYGPHTMGPEGCLSVEFFSRRDGQEPYTEDGRPFADVLAELNDLDINEIK
jgi:hypothetical protein